MRTLTEDRAHELDEMEQKAPAAEEPVRRKVMRKAAGGGEAATASGDGPAASRGFSDAINAGVHGGGQALPDSLRDWFERSLGTDLGGVRGAHTDAGAVDASRSLNARAFAVGQDVVMGAGQYAPETPQGQFRSLTRSRTRCSSAEQRRAPR